MATARLVPMRWESSGLRSSSRAMEEGSKSASSTSAEEVMLEEGRSRWLRPFLLGSREVERGWDLVFFIGGEEMEAVEVGEEETTELAAVLAVAVAERLVGRDMKVIKRRALSSEAEQRKF